MSDTVRYNGNAWRVGDSVPIAIHGVFTSHEAEDESRRGEFLELHDARIGRGIAEEHRGMHRYYVQRADLEAGAAAYDADGS